MSNPFGIDFGRVEVAIVENQSAHVLFLKDLLERLGCQVVWSAKNQEEAQEKVREKLPRVVFVDLKLLNSDSYESGWYLIKEHLQARDHSIGIIIYSGTPVVDEIVLEAIRLGCSYIVKEDMWSQEIETIVSALLAATTGSVMLSREVARSVNVLAQKVREPELISDRELEVLRLVAKGCSNAEIGEKLHIEVNTVKSHVSKILEKLGLGNRVQATQWYNQHYNE